MNAARYQHITEQCEAQRRLLAQQWAGLRQHGSSSEKAMSVVSFCWHHRGWLPLLGVAFLFAAKRRVPASLAGSWLLAKLWRRLARR